MRGHEPLIKMRLSGKAPDIIFIDDYPVKANWANYGEHCTVSVHNEPIKSLDLRFVVGLTVSITGSTEQRASDLFDACKKYGARVITSGFYDVEQRYYKDRKPWFKTWQL